MAKMNWQRASIEARDARAPRKYKTFRKNRPFRQNAPPPLRPPEPVPTCPRCKSPMIRRISKFGKFWGCTQYPQCRGTRRSK